MINLNTEDFKFCFFIDGLDEHDGDAGEIAEYFWDLSQLTPEVKFSVSSRPWAEFQTIYRTCPKLRLQDLTHDDIMLYVAAFYELACSEGHTALAKELDRALNFQWDTTHLS